MTKRKLLIVENDCVICQSIQSQLQSDYMEVDCVSSVAEALEAITRCEYCLVIMSLRLTVADDTDLLRIIRNTKRMPIMVLTEKLAASDKVALFQAGANACMEKPIDSVVCAAQAASLIHLYVKAQEHGIKHQLLTFGTELLIDSTYRQVIIDGKPLALTRTEFDLLLCLAQHPHQVWSRAQLYHYVWDDDLGSPGDHTVKTHIGNLKKKLADQGKNYVQNSRGVGYKFVPPIGDMEKHKI